MTMPCGGAPIQSLRDLFRFGRHADLADDELLEWYLHGPDDAGEFAFRVLVERHGPMVLRVCRRNLRDEHDAHDAFQATFAVLARSAAKLLKKTSVASWLFGVALRVSSRARVEAARRRKHERGRALQTPEVVLYTPVDDDLVAILLAATARLPPNRRDVVVLCYWEGLTHEAAAIRLGVPVGTVKSRLARARETLKRRLDSRRLGLAPDAFESLIPVLAMPLDPAQGLVAQAVETAVTLIKAGPIVVGAGTLLPVLSNSLVEGVPAMVRIGLARVAPALLVLGLAGSTGYLVWKLDKLTKATVEKDQEVARVGVDRLQGTEYGNLEIPFEHRDIAIPPPKHDAARSRYIVEPPDILDIEVLQALPGRPLTGERLVRPDGTITLGFYGDLHVAGLSLAEVKKKVVLHMRRYLTDLALGIDVPSPEDSQRIIDRINPEDSDRVFVDIVSYNSKFYYVGGDFNLPGRLPITGKETVLDALHLAGGLATSALRSSLRLVKPSKNGGKPVVKQINYESVISGEDMSTNYPLEPGDHLYVERDPKAKVEPNEQAVRENAAMLHKLRTRVEELSKKPAQSLK